jgi:virginiamycin B lyase
MGLTTGPDGHVWVTFPAAHAIIRVGADGRSQTFYFAKNVTPALIISGLDGNLWFSEPAGKIGQLSILGTLKEFSTTALQHSGMSRFEPAHQTNTLPVT